MKYIVKACFNPDFAARMYGEKKPIPFFMQKVLGSYIKECISCAGTSILFIAEDVSGDECRKRVVSAYELLYPGYSNAIDVLITEDDGSERAGVMTQVYNRFVGNVDFLKVCNVLNGAMKFAEGKPFMQSLRSMNYLVSVDSGYGFSTILTYTSLMLSKIGLFYEFNDSALEYTIGAADEKGYTTTTSLINELWSDDRNSQVVGIDISYFLDNSMHDELRRFLIQLIRLQDCFIFLFKVPYLSSKELASFKSVLSDILEIRLICVPPFNEIQLQEYAEIKLSLLGFPKVALDSYDVYLDRIRKEKMDGRFYGLRTADKVINEMIWAKMISNIETQMSGKPVDEERISEADMSSLKNDDVAQDISGLEELDAMVGMGEIKKKIEEIVAQVLFSKNNDNLDHPCIHMRFLGAPGTGKTTVARIIGRIFKEKGILSKGGFFEYEASSLIGEYIGQTAPKARNVCRDAYGSVLFIDEAYALDDGKNHGEGYGKEAITTLIAEMENHRDDMVIIMAGYADEMNKLMSINPGLKSRMPFVIDFKNYSKEQLTELFMNMARKAFNVEPDFETAVRDYMNGLSDDYINSKEFANARFVRNLYERTWSKAAYRAAGEGKSDIVLRKSDFLCASQESEFQHQSTKKMTKVGF